MAISFSCNCGRALRLKDHLAGKKVRCPDCSTILEVPQPDESTRQEEVPEVELAEPADQFQVVSKPPTRYPPPSEAPPEPPRRKRKKRRSSGGYDRDRGGGLSISAGVITGILMIVGSIVWFVVGLWAGWVFFYPPILLVLGIIRLVTALMGSED